MSADKNIKLTDDVLALLKEQAQNEGVSVDEAATEAIRRGLEEGRWRRLIAAGRRYGQESQRMLRALFRAFGTKHAASRCSRSPQTRTYT
jgi:hypothetical protein